MYIFIYIYIYTHFSLTPHPFFRFCFFFAGERAQGCGRPGGGQEGRGRVARQANQGAPHPLAGQGTIRGKSNFIYRSSYDYCFSSYSSSWYVGACHRVARQANQGASHLLAGQGTLRGESIRSIHGRTRTTAEDLTLKGENAVDAVTALYGATPVSNGGL